MKRGKKLTRAQKVLVSKVGLFHTDWNCFYEDDVYLHLIEKNKSPAEIKIIDKEKKKVLEPSKANQDNQTIT